MVSLKTLMIPLKITLLAAVYGFGTAAHAQQLAPLTWYNEVMKKPAGDEKKASAIIQRIAFIQNVSKKGELQFLSIDKNEFEKDTIAELIEPWEFSFSDVLNKTSARGGEQEKEEPANVVQVAAALFQNTYADTVIHAPPNKKHWTVYRAHPKDGAASALEIPAPASRKNPTAIDLKQWLIQNLGYGGVVFDRRDGRILVGSYKPLAASDNAMLTHATEDQLRLQKSAAQGAALLKLISCEKSICIFEILLEKQKESARGVKVIY
jgi:hypothetical protein